MSKADPADSSASSPEDELLQKRYGLRKWFDAAEPPRLPTRDRIA